MCLFVQDQDFQGHTEFVLNTLYTAGAAAPDRLVRRRRNPVVGRLFQVEMGASGARRGVGWRQRLAGGGGTAAGRHRGGGGGWPGGAAGPARVRQRPGRQAAAVAGGPGVQPHPHPACAALSVLHMHLNQYHNLTRFVHQTVSMPFPFSMTLS